jgi:hypothetical protein
MKRKIVIYSKHNKRIKKWETMKKITINLTDDEYASFKAYDKALGYGMTVQQRVENIIMFHTLDLTFDDDEKVQKAYDKEYNRIMKTLSKKQ